MKKDIELLCDYLEWILIHPLENQQLTLQDSEMMRLYQTIEKFVAILNRNYEITENISEGKLDSEVGKDNLYAGPLMELQSILKHLTWQLGLVANGKLDMQIHFLGDFSKTFNRMIAQLKEREQALLENAKLTEALNNQQFEILEKELQDQAEKYTQVIDSMEELRRFRHDMKNHFMCIDSLLLDDNMQGARDYIHSINNIVASSFTLETNDNYIFNALIDEKLKVASQLDVKIKKIIAINRRLDIKDVDICILFGNALDNCIDALKKVEQEKRELSITVILVEDTLSVEIANTFEEPVRMDESIIQTTKSEKHNHGIGLKNVNATVEKYDGEVNIDIKNNIFKLIVVLCKV
ncbi:sensor histidine kinase [Anaerorhabdus furcosa]|uniref:GHKL domain-containing protein n=1 Tax=Anaerorhabdus furcosa TaxID=118967 RepID=A0A1T4QKI9_9FIRM|nr:ATP-binding protein [Anaerorhabdus furcosa]SKA04214.1 GHKL domain-containing protein [Anaerorhabdus furcosa]